MPLRERFPIFQSRTYFDSCSHGALSDEVRQAYQSYLDDRDRFGSHWEVWAGKLETLRSMLAQLLNVSADELATASCLSDCLNSLASAFDFTGKRNKVLLTDFDFPTTSTDLARPGEEGGGHRLRPLSSGGTDDPSRTIPRIYR